MTHRTNTAPLTALALAALLLATVGCARERHGGPESPRDVSPTAAPTALDMAAIKRTVAHLSATIGPRTAGSPQLQRAALYLQTGLADAGYDAHVLDFAIPGGQTSHNVAAATDAEGPRLVLAAHIDTVDGCPGANDDATGLAVILEIARTLKARGLDAHIPLQFVLLGAEEEVPGFEGHGCSAMQFMDQTSEADRRRMAAAVFLDKLGRGPRFLAIHIADHSDAAAAAFAALAGEVRPEVTAAERWSDVMAFEDAGVPTAWIEWAKDPHLHKPTDVADNLEWPKVAAAAELTLRLAESKSWLDG